MNVPRTMALYRPEQRSYKTVKAGMQIMRLKKPDQKFLLFCAISMLTGILAGIFLAVKCRTGNGAAGIFSPYYLKEYAYLDIDRRKLMLIVAKERGKWLLLLWALGFSTVGRFCIYLFPAVWGVIGTLFLAQAFAGMGIAGDRTGTFISGAADPDLCAAVSVDDGRSRQKKQTVCVSSEDRDGREEQQAVFSVLFCGFARYFFWEF